MQYGGGDCDGTPDATTAKQTSTGVWYAFDVTDRAQDYIAHPNNNNGWVIKCTNPALHNQDYFYSSDEATYTTLRPKLVVTDTPSGDVTAPAAVSDLACSNPTAGSVTLTWTAPGDDGSEGTAASYDIRYSTSTINAGNWDSATQVIGEPTPDSAGESESMSVSGLSGDTTYYFAIKTADEVPNWSSLSNVASNTTDDETAPAAITDLGASTVTGSSITLTWTSPGDNGASGTATTYDVRYSTSEITAGNWDSATQATGEPPPAIAGTGQSLTISNLSGSTTYYFAIKTADEVPNWSALSNVYSTQTSDTVAPAAVSNLATSSPTTTSLTLTWTSPGDDGSSGTAASYDVRYSTSEITAGNWDSATQATGEPTPAVANTQQSMTVGGLLPSTTYYFAIKTADDVPNVSDLSNVPNGTTATPTTRQVGSGKTYATVQAAVTAAADWDTIEIDPATYTESDGWATVNKNHLTIRGVGSSRAVLDANGAA